MTELSVGLVCPEPASSAVVTDGAWHRVGFVWGGLYRVLYVDGTEVARDAQLPWRSPRTA